MSFTFTSQVYGFADGSTANGATGHDCVYTAGAPAAGDWDILCVNSDATITTPTGFTSTLPVVNSQGAYVFTRKAAGGESGTVRVKSAADTNAEVIWVRVTGASTIDVTGEAHVDSSSAASSPAFTSSALAASTEFALAFAALHSIGATAPTTPVWGAGYTAIAGTSQGANSPGVAGFVGYKTPVGTAAESPSVSWTNNASDRYLLFVTFTAAAGGTTDSGTLTAALGGLAGVLAGKITRHGTLTAALGGLTATMAGSGTAQTVETGGSWYTLLDIRREAQMLAELERLRRPPACPNDGEPLRQGPAGILYCPYDGWRP